MWSSVTGAPNIHFHFGILLLFRHLLFFEMSALCVWDDGMHCLCRAPSNQGLAAPLVFQHEPTPLPAEDAHDLFGFKSCWLLFEPVSAALFPSQASGSDLQGGEQKKPQNTRQRLHFHRGRLFFRPGEEIRGKQQISAPTGRGL